MSQPQQQPQRRAAPAQPQQYKSLLDDDPFADDGETPVQENKRMQCELNLADENHEFGW